MRGAWRESPVVERIGYGVSRARAWVRRATAWALAVRAVVGLTGLAALLLALPPDARLGPAALVAAVLAGLAAALPGGGWVSVVELGAVAGLVLGMVAGAHPARLPEVALLAALLYVHHSAAALGAMLRTDTVVPAAVLRHWAGRAGAVLAASAVVALAVVGLVERAPSWSATAFVVLGAAGALAVAGALAWLGRRV